MNFILKGRQHEVDVRLGLHPSGVPPVIIVIPQHETKALTWLAVHAIRAFTERAQAHIVVVDNASVNPDPPEGVGLITIKTPVWRWWQSPRSVGSVANAVALECAREALRPWEPKWMFVQHNDALPVKHGWLDFLLSKNLPMVGCKASQRSGYPHSLGTLFQYDKLWPGDLWPNLPDYDVAEGPARYLPHWSAWAMTLDGERDSPVAGWLAREACEVSWDDAGDIFWCHKGGGTINGQDMSGWIQRARKNLGL